MHYQILDWLTSVDPSQNHNAAYKLHEGDTGAWFTDSLEFSSWLHGPGRFLWLNGKSGSGKTVLCSAIIERTKVFCDTHPGSRRAYFYFDFQSRDKQHVTDMLQSFLKQLARQGPRFSPAVETLYRRYQPSSTRPGDNELLDTLVSLMSEGGPVHLILDAMDECTEQLGLCDVLRRLMHAGSNHILATSRDLADLSNELYEFGSLISIPLRSDSVDQDVRTHVVARLCKHPKLKRFDAGLRHEVEMALVDGANGMYVAYFRKSHI